MTAFVICVGSSLLSKTVDVTLEMQPLHAQGFLTSSSQNVSTFGNLSTSFQVKANIDIGKFSGTEPTPADELNFD